jgi:hypothetical protein
MLIGKRSRKHRRAVVAAQVAITIPVILAFAALSVDIGAMYNVKADLQRAADAAALAGASAYTTDEMMQIRMETEGLPMLAYVVDLARNRANSFSELNPTLGLSATHVQPEDILAGWLDLYSASHNIDLDADPVGWNAVEVVVRRQAEGGEGSNEPIGLFFAPIFGRVFGEAAARAVATFDDRFSGFTVGDSAEGALPMTIHEDAFQSELDFGGDQYGWNEDGETVIGDPDGIREIRLYPYPLSGSGYEAGDGNFGVLNIGTGNQGVEALRDQIINGVTPDDLEMEVGTSDLTFYDDTGSSVTYDITGSPGLDAGLTDAIQQTVGDVVAFFLHRNVILSGSNTIYTITQIRFGRVMDIRLTGPPNQRGLYVQPTSYVGGGVHIDPEAPSTGGLVGRLVLAR